METQDPKSVPGNGKGKEESVVPNPTPQPIPTEFKLAEIWLRNGKLMLDASEEFWCDKVRALGVMEYCKDIIKQYVPQKPKIIQPKGGVMNFVRNRMRK